MNWSLCIWDVPRTGAYRFLRDSVAREVSAGQKEYQLEEVRGQLLVAVDVAARIIGSNKVGTAKAYTVTFNGCANSNHEANEAISVTVSQAGPISNAS